CKPGTIAGFFMYLKFVFYISNTAHRIQLPNHSFRFAFYQVLNNIVTFWPSSAMVGPWETQQEFGEIFRHWSSDAYSGLGCCSREFLRRKWPAGWECIGSQ